MTPKRLEEIRYAFRHDANTYVKAVETRDLRDAIDHIDAQATENERLTRDLDEAERIAAVRLQSIQKHADKHAEAVACAEAAEARLATLSAPVGASDAAYAERNKLVAYLASEYPAGVARTDIPGWDAEWHGCVFIDTPEGQMSWHFHDSEAALFENLPAYTKPWDGHTTEEKYARLAKLHRRRLDAMVARAMIELKRQCDEVWDHAGDGLSVTIDGNNINVRLIIQAAFAPWP